MQIYKGALGKSKHDSQGKTTMKSSDPIDVSNQLVELPPTIKMHYSNAEFVADVLHVNHVPFLTSMFNNEH